MKKLFLIAMLMLICGICSNIFAQVTPAGAGDKSLEDRDVKGRSIELERVRRDTDETKKDSASKFTEIKEDFEKMQMANSEIQKLMVATERNNKSINDSSAVINKSALRLKSNLFPNAKTKKSKDKDKNKDANPVAASEPDLKTSTDMMNVAIFDFTHNPMFSDPKFTESDSTKAQSDLEKIINYSLLIQKQSEKTN